MNPPRSHDRALAAKATAALLGAMLLGASGCTNPTLDGNGAIACGANNACPPEFQCRAGRCCPQSSDPATCPSVTYAPDLRVGGTACTSAGSCELGFVCRFGRCCPPGSTLAECPSERFVMGRDTGGIACDGAGRCEQGYECRSGRCCPMGSAQSACPAENVVPRRQVGGVSCGANNSCDPGFECRFDRCCPRESPLMTCPAADFVPLRTDGTLRCDAQSRCPNAHGYTCRQGQYCCPATGGTGPCAPGSPGSPCSDNMMCAAFPGAEFSSLVNFRCLTRVAVPFVIEPVPINNGACSAPCNPNNLRSCGSAGYCVGGVRFAGAPSDASGICTVRCRTSSSVPFGPCRPQLASVPPDPFRCFPINPEDPMSTEGYCFPDCTVDDYCARLNGSVSAIILGVTVTCNRTTHACDLMVRDR